MKIHYADVLRNFEYDSTKGCWIRIADKKAFYLIKKDAQDIVYLEEASSEDSYPIA